MTGTRHFGAPNFDRVAQDLAAVVNHGDPRFTNGEAAYWTERFVQALAQDKS